MPFRGATHVLVGRAKRLSDSRALDPPRETVAPDSSTPDLAVAPT